MRHQLLGSQFLQRQYFACISYCSCIHVNVLKVHVYAHAYHKKRFQDNTLRGPNVSSVQKKRKKTQARSGFKLLCVNRTVVQDVLIMQQTSSNILEH